MGILQRRKTPTVHIGHVCLGSGHPIAIQSMTNTPTDNIPATVRQIKELARAGSELVRITINHDKAMQAVPKIINQLRRTGLRVPIIGDFHYNGHVLLSKYPLAAKSLAKYRINPGNVGKEQKGTDPFTEIIKIAKNNNKPIRIGVNWGSLDQDVLTKLMNQNARLRKPKPNKEIIYQAMVQSALGSANRAQKLGLKKAQIVLSVKMSDAQDTIAVNRLLAKKCDYVLHLGLTEAGAGTKGIASSVVPLAVLLQEGIGDTIRVSLTPGAGTKRSAEVEVCRALLQSMGLRYFEPTVTSCPGCGRTNSDYFQKLAEDIRRYIKIKMTFWTKKYPGIEELTIAVMGCVVNGPGESRHADIGISLPGSSEKPMAVVFRGGKKIRTLKAPRIKEKFIGILENYIKTKRL
ncbi:MAG: flavodoxin-dependent (E)-4-hydroxy-3-methylbut-2-enyl-diphosphate synthase [Candidatus Omnitrophota bacterium]